MDSEAVQEAEIEKPAEKLEEMHVEKAAGISSLVLQCDQCDYNNATDDCTEDEVTANFIEEEPTIFDMGTDGHPKVKLKGLWSSPTPTVQQSGLSEKDL